MYDLIAVTAAAAVAGASAGSAASPTPPPPVATAAVSTLQNVCLPLLRGGAVSRVAPAAGFRDRQGSWVLDVAGRPAVELDPPDVANPHLCTATLSYAPGGGDAIRAALATWAATQTPALSPVKVDQTYPGATYERQVSTWSAETPAGVEGVVLDEEKTPQGKPADGNLGQSTMLVSLTPPQPVASAQP